MHPTNTIFQNQMEKKAAHRAKDVLSDPMTRQRPLPQFRRQPPTEALWSPGAYMLFDVHVHGFSMVLKRFLRFYDHPTLQKPCPRVFFLLVALRWGPSEGDL